MPNLTELTSLDCHALLEQQSVGRLGCARDNQPYIVPVTFSLAGRHIYCFSTMGQKIDWMRGNPRVCLEADSVNGRDDWTSVVVFGTYEELGEEDEAAMRERRRAWQLLESRASWWEPATIVAKTGAAAERAPIFFRVHIAGLTGRRMHPEPAIAP